MSSLFDDLRYAGRQMLRTPGYTLAALLTIAVAVGANTAVFSVVNGVLLRPLPYRDADRLVRLYEEHPGAAAVLSQPYLSSLTFDAWKASARTVEAMGAYSSRAFTLSGIDEPRRVTGASVSPTLFDALGARPAIGRFFTPQESVEGANRVVILSDAFWRQTGSSATMLGTTVTLDGQPHEVIGVAPPAFYFPDREALLWTPAADERSNPGQMRVMSAIARLKPGITVEQASAEGTAAARSVTRPMAAEALFGKGGPVEVRVQPIAERMTAGIRPALEVMAAAVALVFVIACANVASLLLARSVARRHELSIRSALGAGRPRLVRQLLTETLAIALAGGALGALLAWALTRAFPAVAPDDFPRLDDVRVDLGVLAFALMASIAAGLAAGLLPAFRTAGSAIATGMPLDDGRSVSGRGDTPRLSLLAVEAALGVLLLVGASLLARSFVSLTSVDPGYDAKNLLAGRVYRVGPPEEGERSNRVVLELMDRLRAAPGVVAAGAGNMAPFGESTFVGTFEVRTPDGQSRMMRALIYVITPGYAEAMGLRLREGRFFEPRDVTSGRETMMVNETFARTYFAGVRLVGSNHFGNETDVVGVLADVRKDRLDREAQPAVFFALSPRHSIRREINVLIRTAGDPSSAGPLLRAAVRDVAPTAATGEIWPMADGTARSVSAPRFATAVIAAFAAIALLLSAGGLYGVLSYSVSQRTREIGVRTALGATRGNVLALVVCQGLAFTIAGIAAGLIAAALATPLMHTVLFGVRPLDVPSYLISIALMLGVGVLACVIPARRAVAIDPARALRGE